MKSDSQDNNLKIADEIYNGTPGLWGLITQKKPKDYYQQDLTAYKDNGANQCYIKIMIQLLNVVVRIKALNGKHPKTYLGRRKDQKG